MRRSNNVIALCGAHGAGKSQVAHLLESKHGYTVLDYAEPIRAALALWGIERHALHCHPYKDTPHHRLNGKSPRDALILIGEAMRRKIDPYFWITLLETQLCKERAANKPVVIASLRTMDEYHSATSLGATVWQVERTPLRRWHYPQAWERMPYNLKILNHATMADLEAAVTVALQIGRMATPLHHPLS